MRGAVFPATWDAQQRAGEVAGVVDEAVTGVRVVKGFGQEERELDHLADAPHAASTPPAAAWCACRPGTHPTLQAIPAFGQVAVLALGGWLALEGQHHPRHLPRLLVLPRPAGGAGAHAGRAVRHRPAGPGRRRAHPRRARRQRRVVRTPPTPSSCPSARGEVRFEGVRFGYTRSEPVLDGFDLHVGAGEVVGPGRHERLGQVDGHRPAAPLLRRGRGAGHRSTASTCATSRSTRCAARSASCSRTPSCSPTRCGPTSPTADPTPTDAEVRAAAAAAGADALHRRRCPTGYDTVVGERGLTLSGGQRQRIALARAILTDPRILVLDDATSAVDAATEEAIHDTLRELMADRTTILIAHRRSTLRLAHRIVVLDDGRVVDEGTHEELLGSQRRVYRDLLAGPDDVDLDRSASEDLDGEGLGDERPEPALVARRGVHRGGVAGARGRRPPGGDRVGRPPRPGSAARRRGRRRRGGRDGRWPLAATPRAAGRADHLPPADDRPQVDVADGRRAADRRRSGSCRFVRPWLRWLLLRARPRRARQRAHPARPAAGAARHRQRRHRRRPAGAVGLGRAVRPRRPRSTGLVTWGYTVVTGRTAERALFALRVKIFAHLQRLSLDYYDARARRPDHDPHDHRRRGALAADPDRARQRRRRPASPASASSCSWSSCRRRWPLAAASVLPPLVARHVVVPAALVGGLRPGPRGDRRRERQPAGEPLGRAGRPGLRARGPQHQPASARVNEQLPAPPPRRPEAHRPLLPVRAAPGRPRRRRSCSAPARPSVRAASSPPAWSSPSCSTSTCSSRPIQQLSQVLDTWQQATASLEKIEELLDTPERHARRPIDPCRLGPPARARCEFARRALPATRRRRATEALDGVDLACAPGETVALVGETGAGQVDDREAGGPLLRPDRRHGRRRRHRPARHRPRRLPPPARRRAPGGVPVHRHGPRQHRLRPARRRRRRGRGGRPRGRRPRLHRRRCPAATARR